MKTSKLFAASLIVFFAFSSCSDDEVQVFPVESKKVVNLHAPQSTDFTTNPPTTTGDFVKFDFSTGQITTSTTDWDIAFRGTTILVNGGTQSGIAGEPVRNGNAGAYIVNSTFADVTLVSEASFLQDGTALAIRTGSGNGWYSYNPAINAILPIAGKVIVFRTADNKYAKVEILSYYKDSPSTITTDIATNDARYYTFNYVYQPNENTNTFQ